MEHLAVSSGPSAGRPGQHAQSWDGGSGEGVTRSSGPGPRGPTAGPLGPVALPEGPGRSQE
eukprot:7059884-Pyramimonas_sp.AAC.1